MGRPNAKFLKRHEPKNKVKHFGKSSHKDMSKMEESRFEKKRDPLHAGTSERLTYQERKNLPKKDFAIPERRAYPIEDEVHARNALARVSQDGTPEEKHRVRLAVKKRYPDIRQSHKVS